MRKFSNYMVLDLSKRKALHHNKAQVPISIAPKVSCRCFSHFYLFPHETIKSRENKSLRRKMNAKCGAWREVIK
jgi:hypothetical protein